jgi:hypothetical protein
LIIPTECCAFLLFYCFPVKFTVDNVPKHIRWFFSLDKCAQNHDRNFGWPRFANEHFLTKSTLFFQQSMGTQNGNFTHFYLTLQSHKTKLHFKNIFCISNFAAVCSKTAIFLSKVALFFSHYMETQIIILHISIDPSSTHNNK